jgi:hypothetical protein
MAQVIQLGLRHRDGVLPKGRPEAAMVRARESERHKANARALMIAGAGALTGVVAGAAIWGLLRRKHNGNVEARKASVESG